ncbi:MAG: alpha-N-acetylglucosaminidase TIM-barrel domain-containing protein, partial [Victivallaceae bacterium]
MLKILKPSVNGNTYGIAAEEFRSFYEKITGIRPEIITADDKSSDLIVIGSDAVNPFAAEMIFAKVIKGFRIKYDSDDYHLLSARDGKRKLLFIAGGRGRAVLYAVYDFFERRAGCRYFWDGDIVPQRKNISIEKLNIAESPRFKYRGIRYFAHRSLHRFQAEHWDWDDWKKEIDWILKKRLNLFMLRIGQDDLFQKAFPEIVKYPAANTVLPEAIPRTYNDRTLFWSLEYRGELRKKILDYAFDRDLLHPEDFGTVTHWYSRTPKDFLKKVKPEFLPQTKPETDTGMVWDIRKEKDLDNYFKLTETHIREYGRPDIFHTIGLAERMCFKSRDENLKLKLLTYRLLLRKLREHYPNSPLLLASWDFAFYWENSEVKALLAEFDPDNTLVLEYTADTKNRRNNFTKWNLVGKFPWIFGIFHAYEPNSEIRGDYSDIVRKLKIAADDDYCRGMVFWPETSHSDTLMLEFFTANSWSPLKLPFDKLLAKFCKDRYCNLGKEFYSLWTLFLPLTQLLGYCESGLYFYRILQTPVSEETLKMWEPFYKSFSKVIGKAPEVLSRLSRIRFSQTNIFLCRDILDVARTVAERVLFYGFIRLELEMVKPQRAGMPPETLIALGENCFKLLDILGDLIGTHPDYSLYASFLKLGEKRPVNPVFENTLKGNAENNYCRACIYELIKNLYLKEIKVYLGYVS